MESAPSNRIEKGWPRHPLKELSTSQIETALGELFSRLAQDEYEVIIHSQDFEPKGGGMLNDAMALKLLVRRKLDLGLRMSITTADDQMIGGD